MRGVWLSRTSSISRSRSNRNWWRDNRARGGGHRDNRRNRSDNRWRDNSDSGGGYRDNSRTRRDNRRAKGVKRLLEETILEQAEEDVGDRGGEVAQGTTLRQTREVSEVREGTVLELVLVLGADVGAEGTKEGVEIESNFRERRERLHSKADSSQVREDKVAKEDLMQKGHTKG